MRASVPQKAFLKRLMERLKRGRWQGEKKRPIDAVRRSAPRFACSWRMSEVAYDDPSVLFHVDRSAFKVVFPHIRKPAILYRPAKNIDFTAHTDSGMVVPRQRKVRPFLPLVGGGIVHLDT